MHETHNNYEKIANVYTPLTKIISLGGNERTQDVFLEEVRAEDKVLVVGCGSVDFSVKLAKVGAEVTCLDISQEMLNILRRKAQKASVENRMEFICCNVMSFERFGFYDHVAVSYFLNVFDYETMIKVFNRVIRFLKPDAKLFLADEVEANTKIMKMIQKIVRPIIYHTHHLLVNNSIHEIYDYVSLLEKHNFIIIKRLIDKSKCMQSIVAIRQK